MLLSFLPLVLLFVCTALRRSCSYGQKEIRGQVDLAPKSWQCREKKAFQIRPPFLSHMLHLVGQSTRLQVVVRLVLFLGPRKSWLYAAAAISWQSTFDSKLVNYNISLTRVQQSVHFLGTENITNLFTIEISRLLFIYLNSWHTRTMRELNRSFSPHNSIFAFI